MSFWKNLIGIEEEDEDELDEEFEVEEEKKTFIPKEDTRPLKTFATKPEIAPAPVAAPAKPVAPVAPSAPAAKRYTEQIKLVVIKPQSFDDSSELVDTLKAKKPIIINLEDLDAGVARKIFDFLSGATYALNGNVQKVANNIFLFAPENVDVSYTGGKAAPAPSSESWN